MNEGDRQTLIKFAGKIGTLEQGLKDLTNHFTNHLSNHKVDRILQFVGIGLQTFVIVFLGYLKINGVI